MAPLGHRRLTKVRSVRAILSTILRQGLTLGLALGLALSSVSAVLAQSRGFIRDAEIEATLKRMAEPIISAAGLAPGSIDIVIVNDRSLNAFVSGRRTVFLHSGLLSRLKTVEMIQAVIAHEVGHIAGGHQINQKTNALGAQTALGIGALIAGLAGASGGGEVGAAVFAGAAGASERIFLKHTRAQEAAADQASIRYMAIAGIDPQGALDTLELFRGQEALVETRRDPYSRTHPLTSQRISLIRDAVASAKKKDFPRDATMDYWHARMVAKFDGFLRNPSDILRRASGSDSSEIATYRRAIANHRLSNLSDAHAQVDALIKARPNDPYYRELKGQFYLESGRAQQAIEMYRQALARAPSEPLIKADLARALLQIETQASAREALQLLQSAEQSDRNNPRILQYLALAYARSGDRGRASLATAERYALSGRVQDAGLHANRALGLLPEGTPAWRKADEIARVASRQARQ